MKKIFLILISVGLFLYTVLIFGQVTIGADKEPENFAVLELVSNQRGGLRLPQMTTHKRDSITNSTGFKTNTLARGLQIFNTTSLCVETWNGIKWISECMDCSDIAVPSISSFLSACLVDHSITFTASPDRNYKW
ncbi:MAG: hypothetical protein LBB53_00490, partial [Prevotellaceae bacterium]|nr:hypothetical protein [Prevotellaceae bacterium]